MQRSDIARLNHELQRYYGERYAGLTAAMADLWLEKLHPFPADLAVPTVKRFASAHPLHIVPALDDLAALMEQMQREQRQAARQQSVAQRSGDQGKDAETLVAARIDPHADAELSDLLQSLYATLDESEARRAKETPPPSAERNVPDHQKWLPLNDTLDPDAPVLNPWNGPGLQPLVPQRSGEEG